MKNINHNLHKVIGLGLVAAISLSQSCKKSFLDKNAAGTTVAAQFWKTSADATAANAAMYADLHSYAELAFPAIAIESMGSDDADKGSVPSDASYMDEYRLFTVTPGEGQLEGFWTGVYNNINFANQILQNVPAINMDASLKARYLAEAQFIRAYDYFRLVRAFGDIPLRLVPPASPSDYNLARTPKAQVYAQIEADLTAAANVLPTTYSGADVGRVTKGAALALHAKVSMYLKNWNDVVTYTNDVTALGVYSLFGDYEKMFRIPNKNNSESIFEIQNALVASNPSESNSQYSQVQGPRVSNPASGWGFNCPSTSLLNEFEAGDPRKAATAIVTGTTTAEGDMIDASAPNPYYNYKSYVPFSYYNPAAPSGCQQDFMVLRYADVLLMNAEANNENGNTLTALASLNAVRKRAREGDNSILPDVTTTDQTTLRNDIWHERRVELGMEFDRHADVIRQGRGAAVFGKIPNSQYKAGKSELWPIPQNEIDLSGGTLTQNPGY